MVWGGGGGGGGGGELDPTAVSSVTIGFVIRLNKPNYGIDKYGVQ